MSLSWPPKRLLIPLSFLPLTLLFFWKILLTNLILVGVDTFLYFYPYKAYAAAALRQGRLPLWNPHLFMGAPLLANSQVGLLYPLNWPLIWLDAPRQVAWSIGLHLLLAAIFMLAFTRHSLGLGWAGAWLAAILFAFGGYLGAQVEHINQLNAAAWLPLLFLLYDVARRAARPRFWTLLLALVVALTLLAGHAQTVFISLFGLGLYALWHAFEATGLPLRPVSAAAGRLGRSLLRHLGPLVVVSGLAVALAAVQLLPTAELSAHSIRGQGLSLREVVSFSLRPTVLHYALLPPFNLDLSQPLGEAFGEWVAYVGIGGLLLALLGSFQAPRRFLFLAAAGLGLSLGMFTGPVYALLYYLVPGFNLFRVPARWLLLYAFAVAVIAGFGLDTLHRRPARMQQQLASSWAWLRARLWRLLLFMGLPLLFGLLLVIRKTPPPATLAAWLLLTGLYSGLLYLALRRPIMLALLLILPLAELFWAARSLGYNHPTAPQAYHSLRNSVAFLRAAEPPGPAPPDRFLSLSGITYDPGDLAELHQIYGPHLSDKGLYKLIVATKEKEVLFYNLPLLYGLHSVDGYDGGILPLAQFISLQRLFLPPDELSIDGRLREKLRFVPPGRLLALLNTRWIITDKQFDVWIDDIFYDLQFPAHLEPGQAISTTDIPPFPATAIGLVSHLEGAATLPDGSPVADLAITYSDGTTTTCPLMAGVDTAEGRYPAGAAHPQAQIGVAWPYQAGGVDYITRCPLAHSGPISQISLTARQAAGQFVLRGLSLINQPTTTGRSLILSTQGQYRAVHSGDVKIYENQAALPRAFIVHRAVHLPDEAAAIATLQDPAFDPGQALVRLEPGQPATEHRSGQPGPAESVTFTAYQPERVELAARLASPGWLLLTDAYYPGWQATISGRPAEIFRADLMFRAVAVPAGEHTITFEYKPRSLRTGALISGLALLLLAGGLLYTARRP